MTTITWIKCSDELPDDESVVLLAFADGDVWTGFRDADVWRYVSADAIEAEVTHWAHLPPHPDDEKDTRCPNCRSTDEGHSKVLCCMVEIERLRRAEAHALSVVQAQQETIERLRAELICVCNLLVYLGRHAEDGKYCQICDVVARARKIAAASKGEGE